MALKQPEMFWTYVYDKNAFRPGFLGVCTWWFCGLWEDYVGFMERVKWGQNQKVLPSQLKSLVFQASLPRCAFGRESYF